MQFNMKIQAMVMDLKGKIGKNILRQSHFKFYWNCELNMEIK